MASEPFKVSDGFYGTGETFLFTFNPEFEVYSTMFDVGTFSIRVSRVRNFCSTRLARHHRSSTNIDYIQLNIYYMVILPARVLQGCIYHSLTCKLHLYSEYKGQNKPWLISTRSLQHFIWPFCVCHRCTDGQVTTCSSSKEIWTH